MQMQIYRKSDGELVAWLDTLDGNIVVNAEFGVRTGSDLRVREGKNYEKIRRCAKADGEREKVYITGAGIKL